MPAYARGVALDQLRFVRPLVDSTLLYGWYTKDFASLGNLGISAADLATLGHVTSANLGQAPGILRANRPKPPRVTRIFKPGADAASQKGISTFCDATKLAAALAAKWKRASTGRGVAGGNARKPLVAVECGGSKSVLYGFTLNAQDIATFGGDLGLKTTLTDTDYRKMAIGASLPRPAKVAKMLTNGSTFSSFADKGKLDTLRQGGWTIVESAVDAL